MPNLTFSKVEREKDNLLTEIHQAKSHQPGVVFQLILNY